MTHFKAIGALEIGALTHNWKAICVYDSPLVALSCEITKELLGKVN